jgi:hypothetical protein
MVSADLDITIGDTFWSPRWAIVLGGAAVDLAAGWSVRAQVRQRPDAGEVLYTFDPSDTEITTVSVQVGGVATDTSAVRLYIPATVTETFEPWSGAWDLELANTELGPGETLYRKTVLGGRARARQDVTRGQ